MRAEMRLWLEALADLSEGLVPALIVAGAAILPWIFLCMEL